MRRSSWAVVEEGWATGTRLWVRDKTEAWVLGIVTANVKHKDRFKVTVQDSTVDRRVHEFLNADNVSETEDMKYMNTSTNANMDNLVDLIVLNEPEMLHCLESRYKVDKIYTYTGPILIALNPFKALPALYNKDVLEFYYNFGLARANFILQQVCVPDPPPHVYAIADRAYRDMMSGVQGDFAGSSGGGAFNQSILISGESGAGKTESTKLIMQYVTIISSESRDVTDKSTVMDKVLLSNPILESVGNAKTLRNDNSSRFGKFIALKFNKRGFLNAGFIQTYMLEKVRVVSQQVGERNYHVFYQMAAGGSEEEKRRWNYRNSQDFLYTNQGKVSKTSLDDGKGYSELRDAFDAFEIKRQDQECILNVMAALLHLGQIQFVPDADGEGSVLAGAPAVKASLATACALLGVSSEALSAALTSRSILVFNDPVLKPLTCTQASDARDAVVKAVYSSFFDWLVTVINAQLVQSSHEVRAEIGILDIFGFEYFQHNSFEQLCINYANEALQQHFVSFVFEYEQKEYREEGIEWSFVEFKNNKSCLDLIDMKQKGIFSMIDDECFIPRGSDANLASRMYKELSGEACFEASGGNKSKSEFVIIHFAGVVTYSVATFTEKNRNEFPADAFNLLQGSKTPLIPQMFAGEREDGRPAGGKKPAKTVCSQFKEQLSALLAKIQATKAHYVRCIKPNDEAKDSLLQRPRVVEQLKCAGVLEVVRLSRAGYPYRMTHSDFYFRYRPCLTADRARRIHIQLPKTVEAAVKGGQAAGDACMQLMETLSISLFQSSGMTYSLSYVCQKGKTKIFMPKDTYNLLEGARANLVFEASSKVQAIGRGHRYRRWYLQAKQSSGCIRRFLRKSSFRRNVNVRVHKKKLLKMAEKERMALEAAEQARRAAIAAAAHQKQEGPVPIRHVGTGEDVKFMDATDTWKSRVRSLSRVDSGTTIGPKRLPERRTTDEDSSTGSGGENPHPSVSLLQVHHKKSTELEKMIYKEQFPTAWSTDRLLKLFSRDSAAQTDTYVVRESAMTAMRRLPKERDYNAGQMKLLRVIGATEIVVNKAVVQSISAAVHATGDARAIKAISKWTEKFSSEVAFEVHVSGNLYEAKNFDNIRCFCKQFRAIGFPLGYREAAVTRDLSRQWQERNKDKNGDLSTFPLPVLMGTLRTDAEIGDINFRRRWVKNFAHVSEPPEEGELWCIYSWDKCSFKTLRSFAELPRPSAAFSLRSLQSIMEEKWRFVRRVIRLTFEAVDFMHSCGYTHGALSAETVWLRSFDSADLKTLSVKVTELGVAERLDGMSPAAAAARIDFDHRQLGFMFLTLVVSVFAPRNRADMKELRARIAKVKPDQLDKLSSTFNIEQNQIGHRELQRLYEDVCNGSAEDFFKVVKSVIWWTTVVNLLYENEAAGWNLIIRLLRGGKLQVKISTLLDQFDPLK